MEDLFGASCAMIDTRNAGLLRMLDTGEHSDLILICADKTPFFVHKAIVCAHSNFFWKACQRDSFREGSDNKINLTFGESGIIKLLLVFIYTFDYDNQIHLHILEGSRLLINTDLYSAADFYDIQPLKTQAIAKFNAAAAQFWEEEEEYFPATVQKIYATTVESDRGLRDPAIKLAIKHCTELLKPELNHSPTFMEVLSNNAEVGKDLALASLPTATQFTGWVKRRCIGCNHVWGDAGMGQDCKFRVAANIRFGQVACPKCTCVHNNDCQVE